MEMDVDMAVDHLMEVDYTPSAKSASSTSQGPQTVIKTAQSYETPINTMKQALQSDWSVQSSHHPLFIHLNLESDLNSFQIIQKPMNGQANTLESNSEANLDNPGDCFDFNASQEDEPGIYRIRKSGNVIESSEEENDDMYYIYNYRDVFNETSTTLVNPSPATSIIFDDEENKQQDIPFGLTELGIIHWTRDKHLIPDWSNFPKLGLKNLVKMLNSPTGFCPPKEKECFKSIKDGDSHLMDWKSAAGIRLYKGKWYYNPQCNGVCLKNHVSLPEKERVSTGSECHNPRCSGVSPTFFWEKNQKLYCSVECCDGYQEWHNEVSIIYPIYPTHCYPEIGSMVGYMVSFL
jgi:hypothetical protein